MITCELYFGPLEQKLLTFPRKLQDRIRRKVVETDAKGFVKDIVALTPPSMGQLNHASKKRGEMKIAKDLQRVFAWARLAYEGIKKTSPQAAAIFWKYTQEGNYREATRILNAYGAGEHRGARVVGSPAAQLHQRLRNRRGGINPGQRVVQVIASNGGLHKYIKAEQAKVGKLAAGFNEAARKLGVSMPAWIKRHGTKNGVCRIRVGRDVFSIIISNKAQHGAANDLPRRMNFVLNSKKRQNRGRQRLQAEIRAAARDAGFRR